MDFHDLPDGVTASHVAEMHQADLLIEHEFNCRGLTYWCDEKRKTAFCLIDAPNEEAVFNLHKNAHGAVPQRIIQVNDKIVESFLGRIEDPENSNDVDLNIIDDSAFRVLMVLEISNFLNRLDSDQLTIFTQKFHNSVTKTLKSFDGKIVKNDNYSYLISFKSVSDAVLYGLKVQYKFKYVTPKFDPLIRRLNMALSSGIPVSKGENIFEEAITLATRMCEIVKESFVITSEVNSLYEIENRNTKIDKELVTVLLPKDEIFLTQLMDFIESIWNRPNFNLDEFSKNMGYSKSQLYRKLTTLTGQSPNRFLREFRLHKAIELLHKNVSNISEIAFECGFNSAAYFSNCFYNKYGILPSKYLQQQI